MGILPFLLLLILLFLLLLILPFLLLPVQLAGLNLGEIVTSILTILSSGTMQENVVCLRRLIWLLSILKKKMIFCVRLQGTPVPGWEVGDPVLAVMTSIGLTGLRWTSLLGIHLSLAIGMGLRSVWK